MTRTLLILSGALIVASGIFYYLYADAYTTRVTGGSTAFVIVAAEDIPMGQPMRPEWMTPKEIPALFLEDRHLHADRIPEFIGVSLSQSVRAGEAILSTDLSSLAAQRRTLASTVPHGKRALSLHARRESSFSGMLRPGDHVDVLLRVADPLVPDSHRIIVVAQDLAVLALGRTIREDDESGGTTRTRMNTQISVEVDLEQAQRITLSRRQGEIRLVLRNPNDPTVYENPRDVRRANLHDRGLRESWITHYIPHAPSAAPEADAAETADVEQ